ncbi:MAG: hypothetical protein RL293_2128, partial [Bacteroidota bacterium]
DKMNVKIKNIGNKQVTCTVKNEEVTIKAGEEYVGIL